MPTPPSELEIAPCSAPRSTRRERGLRLSLAAALLCAACGGGGGGSGDAEPTPPAVAPRQASGPSPVPAGCTGGDPSGTAYVNAEVEPFAAAHPTRPGRLLAAWQQDRWSNGAARALVSAVSDDGGATWTRTLHPMSRCGGGQAGGSGDFARATDPWVDFASDGTAFLMGLVTTGGALTAGSDNAMAVSRSTDGGTTWSAPVLLIRDGADAFNDKNTLTADPVAPGHVYAVWDRLQRNGPGPTMLARSTDNGRTWEPARVIHLPTHPSAQPGDSSQTIGNRIVVVPGGAERGLLVNVFTQIDTLGGLSSARVWVQRSTDRGQTWEAAVPVADHRGVGTRDAASGIVVRDGAIIPAIAASPDGTLWVAWQDSRFGPGSHDAIALARSTDGGRSWSAPVAVNRRLDVAAFTPMLAVRADGVVGLLHFDLRSNTADPATLPAEAWLLVSRDGNAWAETRVTGPFDLAFAPEARGRFIGDYHGLVAIGTSFVPVVAVARPDPANRTEVLAPRFDGLQPLALQAGAYAAQALPARSTRGAAAALAADAARRSAHHAAIVAAMERRVPGWAGLVGARPGAPAGGR